MEVGSSYLFNLSAKLGEPLLTTPGSPNIPLPTAQCRAGNWLGEAGALLTRNKHGILNIIVSPLATLVYELCVVGDTVLKTGWVRCMQGKNVTP